jgi:hypothetical protein
MSTDLRGSLSRLAESADVPAPPRQLWERGVRRRRDRRGGLVVFALLVLVLVVSGVGPLWQRIEAPLMPAGAPAGRPGIPRTLYTPSPWTAGTDAAGPIGPLAVIGQAPRHMTWFQAPYEVYGVSATTGTYRFLDLPDFSVSGGADSTPEVALSPDGRHVGYWVEGDAPKPSPYSEGKPVVGFASYDTVTGKTIEHRVPSLRGLGPESLVWVSRSTLMLNFGYTVKNGGARSSHAVLWTPSDGRVQRVPGAVFVDPAFPNGYYGQFAGLHGIDLWTGTELHPRTLKTTGCPYPDDLAVSPDGFRIALRCTTHTAAVGSIDSGSVRVRTIPEPRNGHGYLDVLGWKDPSHVLLYLIVPPNAGGRLATIDVRSGAIRILGRRPGMSYATNLWSEPLVQGHKPAFALDPRWVFSGAVGAVLIGLLVWLTVRKTAQERRRADGRQRTRGSATPSRSSWQGATARLSAPRTCSPATSTTPRTSSSPHWPRRCRVGSELANRRRTCAGASPTSTCRDGAGTEDGNR